MLRSCMVSLCLVCVAGSAQAIEVYKITYPGGVKTYTHVSAGLGIPTHASYPQLNPGGRIRDTRFCEEIDSAMTTLGNYQVSIAWRDAGDAESDTQTEAIYTAVATLPPADGYAVVFDYNMSTWDAYRSPACTGSTLATPRFLPGVGTAPSQNYWDLFTININQDDPYWKLVDGGAGTIGDPVVSPDPAGSAIYASPGSALPGATWAYGGSCWGDGVLETALGRGVLELEGDPTKTYYLSITLDTANDTTDSDDVFPSWGIVNDLSKCLSDLDLDGDIDLDDIDAFVDYFNDGSLIVDYTKDGLLTFADVSAFQTIFTKESEEGCSRDCVHGLDPIGG